jgi:MFS family permease
MADLESTSDAATAPTGSWFNRTVIGAGLTSFLADVGYEMATAILPAFLPLLGLSIADAGRVLGVIEGVADLLSNLVKLTVGWYSDRIGKLCAFAMSWPLVMIAKSLAWIGKGLRGPLRNAILADSVTPANHGKAFGFHRAGDTLGAILGPLVGAALIAWLPGEWFETTTGSYRFVFLFTLLPGLGAAFTFALLVREQRFTPKPGLRLGASVKALPAGFRRWLGPVLVFGIGDFSHALLILAAGVLLAPIHGTQHAAAIAVSLYALKNAVGALAAFPAGAAGDKWGHRPVLVVGYAIGVATMIGFGLLFATETCGIGWLAVLFALGGVYIAIEEAIEPAMAADLVPEKAVRGTAMGLLATVNGIGDFVASVGVGALFAMGPEVGFVTAAGVMLAGTVWLALLQNPQQRA